MAESPGFTLPLGYQLDEFRITQVLGQGGFGITYRATDLRLEREVAIKEYLPRQFAYRGADSKVLPRPGSDEEGFEWGLKRFVNEARVLAKFHHPNIVAVNRYLEANGTAYLVMEYEEGRDLEAWMESYPGGGVAEKILLDRILLPLLDGLEKVHQKGLLHRDIKPENVFMRHDGTPVLIDFGASRAHGQGATANLTSFISAGYSPLEQYGGLRQGPWTDLYALAGTIYRVIAGHKPMNAIDRQHGNSLTPAAVVGRGRYSDVFLSAIDLALSIDPEKRPQSAAAFRSMLRSQPARSINDETDFTVLRRPQNPPSFIDETDFTGLRRPQNPPVVASSLRRREPPFRSSDAIAFIGAAGVLILAPAQLRDRLSRPFEPAIVISTVRPEPSGIAIGRVMGADALVLPQTFAKNLGRGVADTTMRGVEVDRNFGVSVVAAAVGFSAGFVERMSPGDLEQAADARNRSIETGEPQAWSNPETGAAGTVTSTKAESRSATPTEVTVAELVQVDAPMDAIGEPYIVTATSGVNVRGGPGADFDVVMQMAAGQRFDAIAKLRDGDWFLIGRGSVGRGYIRDDLIEPAPAAMDDKARLPQEPVANTRQVEVSMTAKCYTTTQSVSLADGATEEATVTQCRTPNGWVQV